METSEPVVPRVHLGTLDGLLTEPSEDRAEWPTLQLSVCPTLQLPHCRTLTATSCLALTAASC